MALVTGGGRIQALVLCGDPWHPAATARAGLQPLEADGFEFDWIEQAKAWTAERLRRCRLAILARANALSPADPAPDEHYLMHLDDPQAEVFLTTASAHGSEPGGWTRREGQGRVCVLTPGHNLAVWLHPHYQVLIRSALRWCGGDLPK